MAGLTVIPMFAITNPLRIALKGIEDGVNSGRIAVADFQNTLSEIHRKISFYRERILMVPSGIDRALDLQRAVDELILQDTKKPSNEKSWDAVKCKIGCSGCCYTRPKITSDEADTITSGVRQGVVDADWSLLLRQVDFNGTDQEWARLPHQEKKCPFLSNQNTCSIYSIRPMSCRKHFVVSDPKQCLDGTKPVIYHIPEVEFLISAAMDVDKKNSAGKSFAQSIVESMANPKHLK